MRDPRRWPTCLDRGLQGAYDAYEHIHEAYNSPDDPFGFARDLYDAYRSNPVGWVGVAMRCRGGRCQCRGGPCPSSNYDYLGKLGSSRLRDGEFDPYADGKGADSQ